MFGIGFWELVILLVIGLLVVGPERLPEFARDAARWLRRLQNLTRDARREIERELSLDETEPLQHKLTRLDELMRDAPDRQGDRPSTRAADDPAADHDEQR